MDRIVHEQSDKQSSETIFFPAYIQSQLMGLKRCWSYEPCRLPFLVYTTLNDCHMTADSTWAEEVHLQKSPPPPHPQPIHLNSLTAVKCLPWPGVLTHSAHALISINLCDAAFIQFPMTELQTGLWYDPHLLCWTRSSTLRLSFTCTDMRLSTEKHWLPVNTW